MSEENKNIEEENSKEQIPNPKQEDGNDTISPSETSNIEHHTSDIENMEVHHHAHHEGKKNWKTYFWEFLMLFLAVFCGFFGRIPVRT